MKRKISFILSFIIVFLSTIQFSCINSFAVEYNPNDTDLKWYDYIDETLYYMFSQFGCCLTNDKEQWTSNRDAYVELLKNGHYSYNSDGSLTFSEDTVEAFKELLNESLVSGGSTTLGFVYVTPQDTPSTFSSLLNVSAYKDFFSHCSYPVTYAKIFSGQNYSYGTADISNYFYVGDSSYIKELIDANGNSISFYDIPSYYYCFDFSSNSGSVQSSTSLRSISSSGYLYFCTGSNPYYRIFSNSPIKVFLSYSALLRYLNGQAYMYVGTPIYKSGDMTIPASVVNGTSNPMNIYNNITNRIISSDDKTDETITAIIDDETKKYLEEISSNIGDIEDNTQETNSLLEQIYKRLNEGFLESGDHFTTLEDIDRDILSHLSNALNDLSTVLKEQNTLLKNNFSSITDKMSDLLEADNKLYEEITQDFSDLLESLEEIKEIMSNFSFTVVDSGGGSGDSGGGDSGKKSFWTRLGELASLLFTTLLDLVSMILFKFLDGVLYLVNVLVDNASVAFDTVGTSLTNMTDRLTFGSEFFSEIYAHLPPEVTDLITLAISCFVIGGLISYVKSG